MKKLLFALLFVALSSAQPIVAKAYDDYGNGYGKNDQNGYGTEDKYNNQNKNEDDQQDEVINGEWDTGGTHYAPAGGGNKWREDGTFMQKAAGGYIDTETGDFIPSND